MRIFHAIALLGLAGSLAAPLALHAQQQKSGPGQGCQSCQQNPSGKERFDTDGDGKLSPKEKQAAREARSAEGRQPPGSRQEPRQQMIARFDADGDGSLDQQERQNAREEIRHQHQLRRFDADQDGQLSPEEQARADAFAQQMLERFDTDGDGKLNREEIRAAMQEHRQHRQGPSPAPGNAPEPAPAR